MYRQNILAVLEDGSYLNNRPQLQNWISQINDRDALIEIREVLLQMLLANKEQTRAAPGRACRNLFWGGLLGAAGSYLLSTQTNDPLLLLLLNPAEGFVAGVSAGLLFSAYQYWSQPFIAQGQCLMDLCREVDVQLQQLPAAPQLS